MSPKDVTKPHEFIGFGGRDVPPRVARVGLPPGGIEVEETGLPRAPLRWRPRAFNATKPYKIIGFGAMDATKPYNIIGFGAMDATKPYKFVGFGA